MPRGITRLVRRWVAAATRVEQGPFAWERLAGAARSRREALGALGGAALAGAGVLAGCGSASVRVAAPEDDDVVVLGAGLAGLTACHALARAGVRARVFEAAERVGGRTRTRRQPFPGVASPLELGGEFIDSSHVELLGLAKELGLTLLDLQTPALDELDMIYEVGGQRVSERELVEGLTPVARAVREAQAEVTGDISYLTPHGAERLDRLPLSELIAQSGASREARSILEVAYLTEYGIPLEQQSSLNLVMMFSDDALDRLEDGEGWSFYGDSDERWKIVEGNGEVCARLAERYADRLELGAELVAMATRADGKTRLSFADGREVVAARVVCALPFSTLRRCDLGALELPAVKRRAIAELGYGMNAKLCVPWSGRPWLALGQSGAVVSDGATMSVWDPHAGRDERLGILTQYFGGRAGSELARGEADEHARRLAAALGRRWPGLEAARRDGALRVVWPEEPFARGSYAGYLVGQWTGFGGAEAEPAGGVSFAGEHASSAQGFMGGAVESGYRAAREVLGLEQARAPRAATRMAG